VHRAIEAVAVADAAKRHGLLAGGQRPRQIGPGSSGYRTGLGRAWAQSGARRCEPAAASGSPEGVAVPLSPVPRASSKCRPACRAAWPRPLGRREGPCRAVRALSKMSVNWIASCLKRRGLFQNEVAERNVSSANWLTRSARRAWAAPARIHGPRQWSGSPARPPIAPLPIPPAGCGLRTCGRHTRPNARACTGWPRRKRCKSSLTSRTDPYDGPARRPAS